MKKLGIRQYVARLTLAPLLIMALTLEAYFLHDRFSHMDHDMLEKGELLVHQLASSSEYGVFSNNVGFLESIANGALDQPDVRSVLILSTDFRILASAGEFSSTFQSEIVDRSKDNRLNIPAAGHTGDIDDAVVLHASAAKHDDWPSHDQNLWLYHAIVPAQISLDDLGVTKGAKQIGAVIVEISRARHEAQKTNMFWATLLTTILFLALTSYLVFIASRRITLPIRELSDAVQKIGTGRLETRLAPTTSVREFNTLAQGLNTMAEQLLQERERLQMRIDEATHALREKKNEAERATQDKSRFLAVASHDLRQPLHALGLYAAELQRKATGTELQRLSGQIEQSIEALSELLNALLDISKLDAGAIVPQLRPCNVNAMLERIKADFHLVASLKNIRLVVRPCAASVTSDPLLLERILANLVSNALRYTYPNGKVLVACRRRGQFLCIEVRDSGVGISKSDQENIYREFFQLTQPQLDTGKGLGLGLSIVDRLVKLLKHRLELRSAPGKGSVFSLYVPLMIQGKLAVSTDRQPAQSNVLTENDTVPLLGKKILIVDDDAAVLSGTSGVMAAWGCQVDIALSIAQVRQLLLEGKEWDMVISDYQLGDNTNGIEVIDLVRQQQNRQLPCILISGDTSQAVLKLASIGGHPLMYKPVKPAKLRSLILHLLAGDTYQQ